jgi:hypothetical protein
MSLRDVMNSPGGRVVVGVALVLAAGGVYWSARANLGPSEAGMMARDRLFICAKSGKSFEYRLGLGDTLPVPSPHSHARSGYPAELCYWTAEGNIKSQPTAVLLNSYVGRDEPTFCPDCGRLVVGHNPVPSPGEEPPPTRAKHQPEIREGR